MQLQQLLRLFLLRLFGRRLRRGAVRGVRRRRLHERVARVKQAVELRGADIALLLGQRKVRRRALDLLAIILLKT